jgi:predicted enzyme related to lactoylglutathione lyase
VSGSSDEIVLNQVNIISGNMASACTFYRLLGLPIDAGADEDHIEVGLPNDFTLELDSERSVSLWDGSRDASPGGGVVLGFAVPTRDAVDAIYRRITEAGFRRRQPPYDAFWGGRYAIVEDPSGNSIGLMSPIDADRKYWPPKPPPTE